MGKAILIEKGGDLVGLARDLLLSGEAGGPGGQGGKTWQNAWWSFPAGGRGIS